MLELAILGLLLESPMHGYELRKRLTACWVPFAPSPTVRSTRRFDACRPTG